MTAIKPGPDATDALLLRLVAICEETAQQAREALGMPATAAVRTDDLSLLLGACAVEDWDRDHPRLAEAWDRLHSAAWASAAVKASRAHGSAAEPATVSRVRGDSPGGTGPQNPAQGHEYLSTSCLHAAEPGREELHGYCQSPTGSNGDTEWAKAPASCKFCSAPCVCPCHRARTGSERKEAGDG